MLRSQNNKVKIPTCARTTANVLGQLGAAHTIFVTPPKYKIGRSIKVCLKIFSFHYRRSLNNAVLQSWQIGSQDISSLNKLESNKSWLCIFRSHMLKRKNTAKYECCKQCQALQRGLFLLLFELLIGGLSATVTVLALMMKQEELCLYLCRARRTRSDVQGWKRRETAGLLFTPTERDRNRESKMCERENGGGGREETLALEVFPCNVTSYCLHSAQIPFLLVLFQASVKAVVWPTSRRAAVGKVKSRRSSSPLGRGKLRTSSSAASC